MKGLSPPSPSLGSLGALKEKRTIRYFQMVMMEVGMGPRGGKTFLQPIHSFLLTGSGSLERMLLHFVNANLSREKDFSNPFPSLFRY